MEKLISLKCLSLPFSVSPIPAGLRVLDKIISAMIPAAQILATARFVDTVLLIYRGEAAQSQVYMPLLFLIGIVAYSHLGGILAGFAKMKLDIRLEESVREAVIKKRAKLAYRHIEDEKTWDLAYTVGADPAGRIDKGFDTILRAGEIAVRSFTVLALLFTEVWWASLVVFFFSVPLMVLAVKAGKTNYDAYREAKRHDRAADYLRELLSSREAVEERALFGYTGFVNQKWLAQYEAACKMEWTAAVRNMARTKIGALLAVFAAILISGVLIGPLRNAEVSTGMFIGFVTAAFSLVRTMAGELSEVMHALAEIKGYERDYLAFDRLSEADGALDPPDAESQRMDIKSIEFKDVTFAYPGCRGEQFAERTTSPVSRAEQPVLSHFSAKLYAGVLYAVVGANGAGKTTLTKLLTGLYDQYTGEILVNGIELRQYTPVQRKAMFSVVYQDFAKYYISARDSIALGNVNGVPESRVTDALHDIGLSETVQKLPAGLDTPLGKIIPGGVGLSGGEWQRLAIARSLAADAPVRILDEPTAALDPVAESEIYALYSRAGKACRPLLHRREGKIVILITHRLAAAKMAAETLVMADGRVAERGGHDELMEKKGLYAHMFASQRSWYM